MRECNENELLVDCCMSLVAPQQNSNVTTVFLIETAAQIIINLAGCFKNSLSELKVCNKPCFLSSNHNQQPYSPWCSVVFQFKKAIGLDFPWCPVVFRCLWDIKIFGIAYNRGVPWCSGVFRT